MIKVRFLKDTFRLLKTPFGRMELWKELQGRSKPVLCRVAGWYRRIFLCKTCIIAITGTYGKTTAQRAISVALGMKPDRFEKSNALTGVAKNLLMTPPWRRFAPLEAGIFLPGQMIKFARMMHPNIVVINSIGMEHQHTFKTLENTIYEKAQILTGISSHGIVLLNGDDPHVLNMRQKTACRVITYGFKEGNQLRASHWEMVWPEGSQFQVSLNSTNYSVRTQLHSRHMAYPALAALAVAYALNHDMQAVVKALEHLTPARSRMCLLELKNNIRIIQDDYKSSPETMEAALDFFNSIPASRRIVVLGNISDPPNPQRQFYRRMGEKAGGFADLAFFLGECDSYASGAVAGGMSRQNIFKYRKDWRQAAESLAHLLQPGDVLLIKGRLDDHLERITLFLSGQKINCWRTTCRSRAYRCENCPMREKGW